MLECRLYIGVRLQTRKTTQNFTSSGSIDRLTHARGYRIQHRTSKLRDASFTPVSAHTVEVCNNIANQVEVIISSPNAAANFVFSEARFSTVSLISKRIVSLVIVSILYRFSPTVADSDRVCPTWQTRTFGNTDLQLSSVGFGAMTIGGAFGDVDDAESLRALNAGIECWNELHRYI